MSFLRRLSLFAMMIAALSFLSVSAEPAAKPSQEQIAQWVHQLGDDNFSTREAASKNLYEAGEAAEAALREAMVGDDAEVARRAGDIIEKFKWGLYPEAPKEIVNLVTRYRSSTPQGKNDVIRELLKAGPSASRTLLKIVGAEDDPTVRYGVFKLGHDELALQAPQRIADEKYESLEPLVELIVAVDVERGAGYYAAYWQMRGKLDERIAHLKAMKGRGFDVKKTWEIIAYLYHAKGDLAAARDAAEKADKPAVVEALLAEGGEWKELAGRASLHDAEPVAENLGYQAAYRRLAGDVKGFEKALLDLRSLSSAAPVPGVENLHLAKVLFLNDRPAEAVGMLARSPNGDAMAFEVLTAQTKYKEALDLADKKTTDPDQAAALQILKARTLYLLGEKDKAKAIFARYEDQIKTGVPSPWAEDLIDAEMRLGLKDEAAEAAANALSHSRDSNLPTRFFPKLFPKNGATAEMLWTILRGGYAARASDTARMEPGPALKRLRELIAGNITSAEMTALVEKAEDDAEMVPGVDKQNRRAALAEAALIAKDEPLARSLLQKAGSAAALVRLGDLGAEKKQWDKATEHYLQAWKIDPADPLPLYLSGRALVQAGQEKEGKKRMEQAHWLPLGDGQARFNFLRSLLERRHYDAAAREGELLLRLNPPGSQLASEGMRQVALAAMRRKDYFVAAQLQERSMLVCLKSGVAYSQPAAYLWVPALVHRLRAEGYSVAGDFDAAQRETDLCWTALPGDALVPIEIVPMWDKAGRKKEATELFEKYLAVQQRICDAYPKSTVGHNGLAWLSACCRRNLESAQKHARTAAELDPKNAGVLDTLAEVEFQLGNKEAAIEAQKKAVALEPKRAYFRKQLKRLEAGDTTAERPSENDDE